MTSEASSRDPNFIVIGAARCGTSTVCAILDDHPDVFMSDPKEPGFFCNDQFYARGLTWYRKFFRDAGSKPAVGEGSVDYSKRHIYPSAARRIAAQLPDAKLLYIVRHPLEQIRSNWSYAYTVGSEERPFGRAVLEDASYLATCDYEWQLAAFREAYPGKDNVLVLFVQDLKRDELQFAARMFQFLGLDAKKWKRRNLHVNAIDEIHGTRSLMKQLQRLPGYYSVQRRVPKRLRTLWRSAWSVRREVADRARWEPAVLQEVLPVVEARSASFLRAHGKPVGHWDFDTYRAIALGEPDRAIDQ